MIGQVTLQIVGYSLINCYFNLYETMEYILLILVGFIILFIIVWLSESVKEGNREQKIETVVSSLEGFKNAAKLKLSESRGLLLADKKDKQVCFIDGDGNKHIVAFSDVLDTELIQDGVQVSSRSLTGTIGGAILGGALAGGAGSIVGSSLASSKLGTKVNSIKVRVKMRDITHPSFDIVIYNGDIGELDTSKDNGLQLYEKIYLEDARKVMDFFTAVIEEAQRGSMSSSKHPTMSIADELKKLATLRDEGTITEQEFKELKRNILNGNK